MASDKASLLKQRLRRGSDSFSFNALIEGVSTLEEAAGSTTSFLPPPAPSVPMIAEPPAVEALPEAEPERIDTEPPALLLLEAIPERAAPIDTESVRLRWALDTLAKRFTREAALFASALGDFNAESAGFHLAQLNQALELLQPLDPTGEIARGLHIPGAPPADRSWPAAAWSFVEFAESPLSGLLPPDADERYVRDVLYNAWGPVERAAAP